ncbi:MAG TPA: type II secretion system protein [Candidatus Saccharimonadales bacterium]
MSLNEKQHGFTIVELLIATTVFSIVLTGLVYAVLFVSDNFIRGSVQTQAQETARSIEQRMSQDIQLNGATISSGYTITIGGQTYNFLCIGNARYSYLLYTEQTPITPSSILQIQNFTSCTNPTSSPTSPVKSLVGNTMRLSSFGVTQVGTSNLYQINVGIVYGPNTQVNQVPASGPPPYTYNCGTSVTQGFFCAIANLNTVVQQRIN